MSQTYLTLRETCAYLPGRPHLNTVRRWMFDGVNGVKLRSARFGHKRLTTEQWCKEFVAAVFSADPSVDLPHHQAEAKLDQLGV